MAHVSGVRVMWLECGGNQANYKDIWEGKKVGQTTIGRAFSKCQQIGRELSNNMWQNKNDDGSKKRRGNRTKTVTTFEGRRDATSVCVIRGPSTRMTTGSL